MIGIRSDLLSRVVLLGWILVGLVFEGIVYFGFWCTLDLVVKDVKLNLTRSNCMSTDIMIVFFFFCRANKRLFKRPGK